MVTVYPIDQKFVIDIFKDPTKKKAKGEVQIIVQPLRYKQKTLINSQCVSFKEGETFIDQSISIFLVLKHSIKDVKGLNGPSGKPFKLKFEKVEEFEVLTDECVEALINCELGYVLNFYANDAITSTPHSIINPATGKLVVGVKFTPLDKSSKKK